MDYFHLIVNKGLVVYHCGQDEMDLFHFVDSGVSMLLFNVG